MQWPLTPLPVMAAGRPLLPQSAQVPKCFQFLLPALSAPQVRATPPRAGRHLDIAGGRNPVRAGSSLAPARPRRNGGRAHPEAVRRPRQGGLRFLRRRGSRIRNQGRMNTRALQRVKGAALRARRHAGTRAGVATKPLALKLSHYIISGAAGYGEPY